MHFPGFCGGSYQSHSVNVDCQTCMNLIPELVESGRGKNPDKLALYLRPALKLFSTTAGAKVRGEFTIRGRTFLVAGTVLYEVDSTGALTSRGTGLADDGLPASFTASADDLLLSSGLRAYTLHLADNTFATIGTGTLNNVAQVCFLGGYFIALITDSNQFYVSDLLDPSSWPDNALISSFPGKIISMIADHLQVIFQGETASVAWALSGEVDFPLVEIPGSAMEQGAVARDATVRLDNTVFFLGGDERGAGIAWRLSGFTPQRVSTHAIENEWQSYSTISDAIAYGYQWKGHALYHIYFPTANKTWVYDVSTGLWHEEGYFNSKGAFEAYHGQCHTYNFGKHLIGDWSTGKIFQLDDTTYQDDGAAIRWVRRAPHMANEAERVKYASLQIDLESGLGPMPPLLDGNGNPRDPQLMMRYSLDSGHTWSNERQVCVGAAGKFKTRAIFYRLGQARDMVFEVSGSDPIKWALVGAYLKAA